MTVVTATPKSVRPHIVVAELQDSESGYRYWSNPMQGVLAVNKFLQEQKLVGQELSDLCCSMKCWCDGQPS